MADQKPLIDFEDKDSWQTEITSVRRYRPVEREVDSRWQSATKPDHLAPILGGTWTDGPWVECSQGWRPNNRCTSAYSLYTIDLSQTHFWYKLHLGLRQPNLQTWHYTGL